jgi:hypothetical protein
MYGLRKLCKNAHCGEPGRARLEWVTADSGIIAPDRIARPTWPFSEFICDARSLPAEWQTAATPACLHLSGFAQIRERIYASAADLSAALQSGTVVASDIVEGLGFFTAVVRERGEILFLNDLMGLEHIYIYEGPGGPIVGNRIPNVAEHLARSGVARQLDVIYAATMLSSQRPLFRQAHAHGLALAGLSLVPFDHYLAWRNGRLERRAKRVLADAFAGRGGGASYAGLIDDAAEELVRNVRVVRESGLFDHVSMDLSGGRDSRVMLGAILRSGYLADTPVNTRDEEGTDDLRCAQRLVSHYGAPHFTGDGHTEEALDPHTSMMHWRSHFAGMYHKMRGVPWSARGSNTRSVRFTGYCGEIYRSFWGKLLPELESDRTAMKGLAKMFDDLVPEFPKAARSDGIDAFAKTILDLPGRSVRDRLDNHYLYFRNRTHFGMRAYHTFHQFVRWPALVSPSLLKASRMLPEREFRRGKAMFDVLDRLAPELNYFAYAGRGWPDFIAQGGPAYERLKDIDSTLPPDYDRAAWEAAQRAARHGLNEEYGEWHREFLRHARAETRKGVDAIRSKFPELTTLLGDDFGERTDRLFDGADPWPWRVAASKVSSIVDIVVAEP